MTGREIFKNAKLSKMTNTRVIKYGKIKENVGYEIVETNSYVDKEKLEKLCILSFVEKKEDKYIHDTDKCVYDSLSNILKYIAECKQAKKIIKKVERRK